MGSRDSKPKAAAMKLAHLLLLVYSLGVYAGAQESKWLAYEPAVVQLEGKLVLEAKYGPPGYGENPKVDQKVCVLILVLSEPVNVRGDLNSDLNTESFEGVKQIQLAVPGKFRKDLIGKKVVVKGSLFRGHTGHHHTNVMMNVSAIRRAAEGDSRSPAS